MNRKSKRTGRKVKKSRGSVKRSMRSMKRKSTKRKSTKRKSTKRKSKKKMNEYMVKLNKARKSGADSFEYNGKTYYKKVADTGMVIYSGKK